MSGTYCATLDNSNCFYDQGYLCKNNSNGATAGLMMALNAQVVAFLT